jgi:hypothetical protein
MPFSWMSVDLSHVLKSLLSCHRLTDTYLSKLIQMYLFILALKYWPTTVSNSILGYLSNVKNGNILL